MSWTGTSTSRHGLAAPTTSDSFLTSDFVAHVGALANVIPLGFVGGAYATGTTNVNANATTLVTIMSISVTIPANTSISRLGIHMRCAAIGANGGATVNQLLRDGTTVHQWGEIGFIDTGTTGQNYPAGNVNQVYFEPSALAAGTYVYTWKFRAGATNSPANNTGGSSGYVYKAPGGGAYSIVYQPYMTVFEL